MRMTVNALKKVIKVVGHPRCQTSGCQEKVGRRRLPMLLTRLRQCRTEWTAKSPVAAGVEVRRVWWPLVPVGAFCHLAGQ